MYIYKDYPETLNVINGNESRESSNRKRAQSPTNRREGRNEREKKREITNRNLTVQEIDNTKEPQKKKIREKVKHVKKKKKTEGKNENALSSFSTVNRILEAVRTH